MSNRFYDSRVVKEAANGRWREILVRLGVDAARLENRHGPCPGCGGRDRFRFDDLNGTGSFLCSQGGGVPLAGSGIALIEHVFGWDWKRAVGVVGEMLGCPYAQATGPALGTNAQSEDLVAAEPTRAPMNRRPDIDLTRVQEFVRGVEEVDEGWLAKRSKIDVSQGDSLKFIGHLYRPDERVLVFVNEHSQGDFCAWVGGVELLTEDCGGGEGRGNPVRTYRLSQERNVKAVASPLPKGGPKGVWFLTNPVSGKWAINPRARVRGEDAAAWSRRSAENIASWRFFVLESDVLDAETWLKVLANVQLPIAAIYTSGGKSIHALMEYEVPSKAHWDAIRDTLIQLLAPLGADPAALTAVRLSRLPGCLRGTAGGSAPARPQKLLYLNPRPDETPIRLRRPLR